MNHIYSIRMIGKVGEVRPRGNGMVAIYLDANYWPERIRDDKKGEQYMGDFHSFKSFKISGSFGDLTTLNVSRYINSLNSVELP